MPNVKYLIRNWKFKKAFSLIELLVAITIIALLVTAATVSWKNAQVKGRDGKRKADLKAVQQALEEYFNVNGKYPDIEMGGSALPYYMIKCNVGTDTHSIDWGQEFTCNGTTYLKKLPQDPNPANWQYSYFADASFENFKKYRLGAMLENTNDPDKVPCAPGSVRNYCVADPAVSTGKGPYK